MRAASPPRIAPTTEPVGGLVFLRDPLPGAALDVVSRAAEAVLVVVRPELEEVVRDVESPVLEVDAPDSDETLADVGIKFDALIEAVLVALPELTSTIFDDRGVSLESPSPQTPVSHGLVEQQPVYELMAHR